MICLSDYFINKLKKCETSEDIDNAFDKVRLVDMKNREAALLNIMGKPKMYFANVKTEEQRYELIKEVFLNKTWMTVVPQEK